MDRQWSFRGWDAAAVGAWIVTAIMVGVGWGWQLVAVWDAPVAAVAAILTCRAWAGRRAHADYQRGLDDGLAMADVVRLREHV